MRIDAEENQKEIIACAKRLFAEQGVANVSMNQIAKTLGIGAGTLYRHYGNKSLLCMALIYDDLAAFIAKSQHYLTVVQESPRRQFQTLLTWYLQFRESNRELLVNVDASSETTGSSYFYASDHYQDLSSIFAQVLQAASPELSTQTCRFRADMLIAMLKSDAYAYQRQVRKLDQPMLTQELTSLFLA